MLIIKINLDISTKEAVIAAESIEKAIAFLRDPGKIVRDFSVSGDNSHQKYVRDISIYKEEGIISIATYKTILSTVADKTAEYKITYNKEEARDQPSTSFLSFLSLKFRSFSNFFLNKDN